MGSRAATGLVLLVLCACAQAAQPSSAHRKETTPPLCCIAPGAAQPDSRGTAEHPLVVDSIAVKSPTDAAHESEDRAARINADQWAKGIGVGTLVLLALQAVALAIQAVALIRTVRSSDNSARIQLRAYVFVESHSLAPMIVGKTTMATASVRNYGRTPARNLRVSANQYLGTAFPPASEAPETPAFRAGTLGPGASYLFGTSLQHELTEEHVEGMKTGALRLFVFGTIYYTDAFQQERFTRFRLMTGGGILGASWNLLYSAPEGNETDEPD
jgi:hypothetical protein